MKATMTEAVDIYLARQPVFDRSGRVAAYELLYRGSPAAEDARGATGSEMTSDVLLNALVGIGTERVADGEPALVNVTRDVILEGDVELFDPGDVYLEIPPSAGGDEQLRGACADLRRDGYRLCLDDYRPEQERDALLPVVDSVKVDVLDRPASEVRPVAEHVRGDDLSLIAGRVESDFVRTRCAEWGFEYFQGNFFREPEMVAGKDVPVRQMRLYRLLNLVSDTSVPDDEIESVFRGDPSLSYRLLRIVNSAAIGGRRIRSIRHALQFLGRDLLHRWLSLLLVSSISDRTGADTELARSAVFRGRFLELMADATGWTTVSRSLFLVGLFSMLDRLTGMPLEESVEHLDLEKHVERALLERSGPYAPYLDLVEAYEAGDWATVSRLSSELGEGGSLNLSDLYMRAMEWASDRLTQTAA